MEVATCREGPSPGGAPVIVEGSGSRAWTRVEQVYPNLPQVAVARPGRRVAVARPEWSVWMAGSMPATAALRARAAAAMAAAPVHAATVA